MTSTCNYYANKLPHTHFSVICMYLKLHIWTKRLLINRFRFDSIENSETRLLLNRWLLVLKDNESTGLTLNTKYADNKNLSYKHNIWTALGSSYAHLLWPKTPDTRPLYPHRSSSLISTYFTVCRPSTYFTLLCGVQYFWTSSNLQCFTIFIICTYKKTVISYKYWRAL